MKGFSRKRVYALLVSQCLVFSPCVWAEGYTVEQALRDLDGLTVAEEHRCSKYDRKKDYRYPGSIETRIIAGMEGKVCSPYTLESYPSGRNTDIEHIVAVSEAHDSGMCKEENRGLRREFARDLLNLTLAAPHLNRQVKRDKDVADWVPRENRCWFVARTVQVRRKYGLTIDAEEKERAMGILRQCEDVRMILCG